MKTFFCKKLNIHTKKKQLFTSTYHQVFGFKNLQKSHVGFSNKLKPLRLNKKNQQTNYNGEESRSFNKRRSHNHG